MIEIYERVKLVEVTQKYIRSVIEHVLTQEKKPGEVVLTLIGDARMKKLNFESRGKNYSTDVLSFPLTTPDFIEHEHEWGDIFVCVPQIRRQARELGISFKEEFTRMLIHGTLHLLGYDHEEKHEADDMFLRQEKYLKNCV